jgi:integrase
VHLTDLKLRALPFEEGQHDYTDDAVRGLSVRIGRRTKTFLLIIGKGSGRRRVKVGQYPDLTLAEAREKARDLLAEARLRKDEERRSTTFGAAFEQYKRVHLPTMRLGSQQHCVRLLTTRFASLHKRKLDDIKTAALANALDAINAPSERMNSFIWLRALLNWCYRREYLNRNPLSRLKAPPSSQTRDRVLSDAELVRVWNASSEGIFGGYIRVLILTAQRKGQWLQYRPEFIEGETIVFPASVMKGKRTHSIPLTPLVSNTIRGRLFNGFSEGRNKRELLRNSQTSGWTVHDLRRTAATRMAELGIYPHVIERLLAHAMPGVAARYNRASYMNEMREALLAWEARIEALLSNKESMTNGRDLRDIRSQGARAAE